MNQNNPLYMMLPYVIYGHLVPRPRTPLYSKDSRPKHSLLTPSRIKSPEVFNDRPKYDLETYFLLIQARKKWELLKLDLDKHEESLDDD